MFNRRFLMAGGLAMAAAPFVAHIAQAQAGRPMLIFMGYETSEECKTWRSKWAPIFVGTPAYKKMDYRAIYPRPCRYETELAADTAGCSTPSRPRRRRQRGSSPLSPRAEQRVIFTATGNKGWQEAMWPIMDVTGTKA